MSTLGELVAFRALVNLLGGRDALAASVKSSVATSAPLPELYARFTDEQHCAEIARLLPPPGMQAEVKVVYQTVENLRLCLASKSSSHLSPLTPHLPIGDWYFTGAYPTPGGYRVLDKALENYLEHKSERSY